MQIRVGNKKLVMFIANSDDILEDDLIKLLKGNNPSWTIKDCEEVADLLKHFGFRIFELTKKTITGEINAAQSQQQIQQEFGQLKMDIDTLAKRKGINFR